MESVTRHVRDLTLADRSAIERVVGHSLSVDQRLTIQVTTDEVSSEGRRKDNGGPTSGLPDWCNVYAGLSDDQILALEGTILSRASLDRSLE